MKSGIRARLKEEVVIKDCMAEDAVLCELLSGEIPVIREKYREIFR